MTRKLYPVPLQDVWDHPDFERMPAAATGMLYRLIQYYWRGACHSIPASENELRMVCRAHFATWKEWQPVILKVFSDVRPSLDAYHAFRTGTRQRLRIAAREAGAVKQARASVARIERSQHALAPTITNFHQLGHVPQREPAPPRPQTPDKRPPRPVRVDTLPRR